jgi:hypothetical protein
MEISISILRGTFRRKAVKADEVPDQAAHVGLRVPR